MSRVYKTNPDPRGRLDVLAMARGDSLESSRLTRTCPRFTYTMNDRAFAGRWVCAMDVTLRIYVELAGYLDRLKSLDLVRVLMPYSEKALLQAAEHVYLEGHQAGARHAWREAGRSEAGNAPEWPLEGLDEERIKALMDPAISVLPEILDKLERSQGGEALTLWRGFGAFCREHLGVDAEQLLRVVLEPAVGARRGAGGACGAPGDRAGFGEGQEDCGRPGGVVEHRGQGGLVGLRNRLEKLEEERRERYVTLVRAFWQSLDVEECALLAAYAKAEAANREPPPGAREFVEARRTVETEEALRRAIGWRESMADEEISARLRHLLNELDPFAGRFEAVRRRYMELTAP